MAQSDAEMMKQAGVQLTSTNEQNPLSSQQQHQEMNTPIDSDVNSRRRPNLPPLDLLTGPREDYLKFCLPLYEASIQCDWEAAKAILYQKPDLVRHSITENGATALHVAASAKGPKHVLHFVKNLVSLMEKYDLELENKNFNTALYLAAAAGNLETIRIMVEKNRALPAIPGGGGNMLPLYAAAVSGNYDVVKYLYGISHDLCDEDGWTHQNRGLLLEKCVENDMFDVALEIVKKYPEVGRGSVLGILARKPDAFVERKPNLFEDINMTGNLAQIAAASPQPILEKHPEQASSVLAISGSKVEAPERQALQLLRFILDDIMKLPKNEFDSILNAIKKANNKPVSGKDTHSSEAVFTAAEMGNTIFVVELIRRYPDIMWKVNDSNQTIFHIAVENRHKDIYNMLYEIGYMKDSITSLEDENGNNMLHLVAKLPNKNKLEGAGGVILQMQRELLWLKEVESMINPSCIKRKNKDGLTAHELFTKEHEDLLAQSVKWVKATANQCVVVATLVATIAFAAAITIPGGYKLEDGMPFFYRDTAYTIFILVDAVSLFTSSISIILFISILTSRFAESDFLESIPNRFLSFLSTLFLSIATMILSFSASFFVIYHKRMQWIPILICVLAILPFTMYLILQYSLTAYIIRSMDGSGHLFKPKKLVLYYQNPVL